MDAVLKEQSSILRDDLQKLLVDLKEQFARLGVESADATSFALEKFEQVSFQEQESIIDMLSRQLRLLTAEKVPPTLNQSVEVETSRLSLGLEDLGLKLHDPKVMTHFKRGDVVEVYDKESKQIYRNLMFCHLSSYSLLDVALNTWIDLYERPDLAIEGIAKRVIEQFTTPVSTQAYGIDLHILKEKYIHAKVRKTFLMDMKYISPVLDIDTQDRVGVVSISTVKAISSPGEDALIQILRKLKGS